MDKAGVRTTEFAVLGALTLIAIAAGFEINANVVTYHANMDLLNQLFLAGMAYIGVRGGGKIVAEARKQPSAEDVAKQVLSQLEKTKT